MTSQLTVLLVISLVGFLAFTGFAAMRTGQWRQFVVLLVGASLFAIVLHQVFGFPIPRPDVAAKGSQEQPLVVTSALYICMVAGMLAEHLYIRFLRPKRQRRKWDWGNFLAPIFVSPIVFIPLQGALQSSGVNLTDQTQPLVMLFLVAFENGFPLEGLFRPTAPRDSRTMNTVRTSSELATRVAIGMLVFAGVFVPGLRATENPIGPIPPGIRATLQADKVWRFDRPTANYSSAFWQQLLDLFKLKPAAKPAFGRSVAFLTGVSNYHHQSQQLPFVDSDLTELRNFLLTQGGFDTVYEARGDTVSRSLIEDYLINKFTVESNLLQKNDRLLFYYSGHGSDKDGRIGFLEFGNSSPPNFAGEDVLEIDQFAQWSRVIVAKHLLIILDACASGLAASPKAGEGPEDRRQMEMNSLSGEGSGFLITAGTGSQKAYGNNQGNSVLTQALLAALRHGSIDDPFITINEVFGRAEKSIAVFSAEEGKTMNPRIWPISREDGVAAGTFVFVNTNARNPSPLPASSGIVAAKGIEAKGSSDNDLIIAAKNKQIEDLKASIAALQKQVDGLSNSAGPEGRSAAQIETLRDKIAAQDIKIKDLQDPLLQKELQKQIGSMTTELGLICESFGECVSRGQRAYQSDDFGAATAFFRQSAIISPESAMGWRLVGNASMAAGRTDEAFAAWDRVLDLHGAVAFTACEEVGQPRCQGGMINISPTTFARYKGEEKIFEVPLNSVQVLNAANRRTSSHITFDVAISGVAHVYDFFPMGFKCPWNSSVTCPTEGQSAQIKIGEYAANTIRRLNGGQQSSQATPFASSAIADSGSFNSSATDAKPYTVQLIHPSNTEAVKIWPGSAASNEAVVERPDGVIVKKISYRDILSLDIGRKRVRHAPPGQVLLFGIPAPKSSDKSYELCMKIKDHDKKLSYCFVSETAVCGVDHFCAEGSDGGSTVQLLADDLRKHLQAQH